MTHYSSIEDTAERRSRAVRYYRMLVLELHKYGCKQNQANG